MGIFNFFKSQMFGGKIRQTIGSVTGRGCGPVKTEIKIHIIEDNKSNTGKSIGIELTAKSILSYQMLPITLSEQETKNLINLLNESCK